MVKGCVISDINCGHREIITHWNTNLSTKRLLPGPGFEPRTYCMWSQCATVLPRQLDTWKCQILGFWIRWKSPGDHFFLAEINNSHTYLEITLTGASQSKSRVIDLYWLIRDLYWLIWDLHLSYMGLILTYMGLILTYMGLILTYLYGT